MAAVGCCCAPAGRAVASRLRLAGDRRVSFAAGLVAALRVTRRARYRGRAQRQRDAQRDGRGTADQPSHVYLLYIGRETMS